MATELKDCPFCGGKAKINEFDPPHGFAVECTACHCNVGIGAGTVSGCEYGQFDTADAAIKDWNRRPALAASGGNAAPPDACPVAITDSSAPNGIKWYIKPPEWLADGMNLYFVPAKIVPASAPNAALVAALEACKECLLMMGMESSDSYQGAVAALSAAGQEVGHG